MDKNLEAKIEEILTRGVAEVVDKEHLKKRLLSGDKIRVKLGIDPTSPNLHLGRAVALLKMKDLQKLGHKIIFIIGDFTGVIGDTSDKDSERPMLSREKVKENMRTYIDQVGKIMDVKDVDVRYNSGWLSKLGYLEIGEQADQFSLAGFSARENVKKRLESGARVSLREVLYPLMQGYDSVKIRAELEIGGTDQRFNLLAGRELQKHYRQEPQDILMVNLIEGTDGRKMSSSWGNTINISDEPNDMFGQVMSIPDNLIVKYLIHCTRIPMETVAGIEENMRSNKLNPRDAKLVLAAEIVKIYHGDDEAEQAKKYFIDTFSKKEIPKDIPEVEVSKDSISLIDFIVLSGNSTSKGEARRKIGQGGVSIEDDNTLEIAIADRPLNKDDEGKVIKIGKIRFVRIKFKK